jgi:hypothetical protein
MFDGSAYPKTLTQIFAFFFLLCFFGLHRAYLRLAHPAPKAGSQLPPPNFSDWPKTVVVIATAGKDALASQLLQIKRAGYYRMSYHVQVRSLKLGT